MKKRIFSILKIVFVNLLLLFVLILIIDPFLGQKNNEAVPANGRNINLKELAPNVNTNAYPPDYYVAASENLVQKNYPLRTDSNGYIIGPKDQLSYDSIDIVFYGGSTTECMYVEDDKRFPYLAGQKLSGKAGRPLIVRNAGVSGKNTLHSTLDFYAKSMKFKPKVVVLMHNVNDLTHLLFTGSYWEWPDTRAVIREPKEMGRWASLKNFFYPKNTVALLKKTPLYAKIAERNRAATDEWAKYRNGRQINFDALNAEYIKALRTFVNIAKSHNINVVLMTQFNRIHPEDAFIKKIFESEKQQLDWATYCDYYSRFNETIRQVAQMENVTLIDLAKEVPADKRYIYDACHLNTAGSVLVSDLIYNKLNTFYQ